MSEKKIKIISCRKLSTDTKSKAQANNIDIVDENLIKINPNYSIEFPSDKFDAIVFSSQNAFNPAILSQFPNKLKSINCFCIEGKTSETATAKGFNVFSEVCTSEFLTASLIKNSIKSVLFICGNDHIDKWIHEAESKGICVKKCIVYNKQLIPHKFENIDGAMFFSPSQVDAFLLENNAVNCPVAFAIGNTTLTYLLGKNFINIKVSNECSENKMIEKVIEYFKK